MVRGTRIRTRQSAQPRWICCARPTPNSTSDGRRAGVVLDARSYLFEGREQLSAALAATPARTTARGPRPRHVGHRRAVCLAGWSAPAAAALARGAGDMARRSATSGKLPWPSKGLAGRDFVAGEDERAVRDLRGVHAAAARQRRRSSDQSGDGRRRSAAVALDRVEEARACSAEILAYCNVHPNTRSEHLAFHYLADCALIEHNFAESLRLYRKSLRLALSSGITWRSASRCRA